MLEGIDSQKKHEFTLSFDKDPKTVFVMRTLTGAATLDMFAIGKTSVENMNGDAVVKMLDSSIIEIKNHPDADKLDKKEIIKNLGIDALKELLDEMNRINKLSESDKKK